MQNNPKNCSVLVLAAGRSERMGSPKHLLRYDDNHTFLEYIVEQYRGFGCGQVVVVINEEAVVLFKTGIPEKLKDVVFVINRHPEWERFYSVQLGLQKLSGASHVFLHNVDNPYASQDVLQSLIDKNDAGDYVVPYYKGRGGHPVLLNPAVVQAIVGEQNPRRNLKDLLADFSKVTVAVNDENVLLNINTDEQYQQFVRRRN